MKKEGAVKFISAVSMLSGTIIGVGLFSLPYITLKVGFWTTVVYFFVLGILAILVHQIFGQVALYTPDLKRLPGFAKYHLGKRAERVALFSSVLGLLGAILAYLIVGGEFLKDLFPTLFFNESVSVLFYWLAGTVLIYFGIRAVAKIELIGVFLFFLVLFFIFIESKSLIQSENLFLGQQLFKENFFFPYGPILFSLWGAALIPEIEEMLRKKKQLLKKVIFASILMAICFYLFFIYLVLGILGENTSEYALPTLKNVLDPWLFSFLLLLGILTTFTSFVPLGLTLKKILYFDLKIPPKTSFFITCFLPLFLYFIGIKKFIPVISFVGGITLAIDGILILLMYNKIKPKRKFLVLPLIFIFLGGIIYSLIYLI